MNNPNPVHIPGSWVQKFLAATGLGEWIMMSAGRFRFPAASRLRCELEILCRYEALYRPLNSNLEAEAQAILAQLPADSSVQMGFLSEYGELQPLLGGESSLPGTAARIDILKEAAACLALEQYIPDSKRIGLGLAFGISGTFDTEAGDGTSVPPFADGGADGHGVNRQNLYALPNCVLFACIHNRETAPDDPFQFLDILLEESLLSELVPPLAGLARAARTELLSPAPITDDVGSADSKLETESEYSTAARQLHGIAAYTTERYPALLHGVIRWAQTMQQVRPHSAAAKAGHPLEVLLCRSYRNEYEPLLEQVDLLIEEDGGRLSAGALAARRHGIPCINGIRGLSRYLHEGSEVFVDQQQAIITITHPFN
jgi:phosphohistidine swiveling domain-containing protein